MPAAIALAQNDPVGLPEINVYSPRVANQEPVVTFAMPVSALRFEPLVDVQARNMAEGQADIAIRGGIFENTGFKVGALSLFDPQTGHYFAEIPIAPAMMSAPTVLTGAENALQGWNANAGTVAYGWRPIRATSGVASVSAGEDETVRGELYQGYVSSVSVWGKTLAADGAFAHSRSDGALPFGEHEFTRYNARVQLSDTANQTDLFYGYQSKYFGWPNLYTPFPNVYETENIQTNLVALNHRTDLGGDDFMAAGGYYRRNKDNYVFNRADAKNPAFAVGPAFHTTWARSAGYEARITTGEVHWNLVATYLDDALKSSSLTFGRFNTREYFKVALAPDYTWSLAESRKLTAKAGLSFDDTNRDKRAISPVAQLTLDGAAPSVGVQQLYASFAKSSQVTSYFATNSRATAGLFRGNPNLDRENAANFEVGTRGAWGGWTATSAVFYRRDTDLVDWTYTNGLPNARAANPVDIDTLGFEAVVRYATKRVDVVLGYTALSKNEDYGTAVVDASFYALNYAEHRLTAAATVKLGAGFEVRIDNEVRFQKENALRKSDDDALLTSVGVSYSPAFVRGLTLSATVENLWDDDFEEVPAVPASPRQFSVGARYAW